jgi:Holliday junction resolvasome RuvABC endonuclease subunit
MEMRIVGIDGSTKSTGICEFVDGKYIKHTLIDCHKEKDAMKRIPMMANKICKYLDEIDDIDVIIMERSILKANIDTLQKLSNLAGAIMLYAYRRGIKFENPVPSVWRKKIGLEQSKNVKREALKLEAIKAVKQEYGLDVSDDEAESILLARSGFDLPQINIKAKDVEEDIWN